MSDDYPMREVQCPECGLPFVGKQKNYRLKRHRARIHKAGELSNP